MIKQFYERILSTDGTPIAIACSPETRREMREEMEGVNAIHASEPVTLFGIPVETYFGLPNGDIWPIFSQEDRGLVREMARTLRPEVPPFSGYDSLSS